MLSIPRAFERSGLILSPIVIYVAALISYLSMLALVKASYYTKLVAMSDLANWAYGKKFKFFTDIVFFANNFGTCVAYTIVAKENLASAFESFKVLGWSNVPGILCDQKSILWILVTQGMLVPLILKEKMTELRIFALISFGVIIYIAATIVINAFSHEYTKDFDKKWDSIEYFRVSGLIRSVPIFIFGFTCQQNVLSCYRELKSPTIRRMNKVMYRQIFLASAIYLFVGMFGYLTFGSNFSDDEQNILTKYSNKNISILIVGRAN